MLARTSETPVQKRTSEPYGHSIRSLPVPDEERFMDRVVSSTRQHHNMIRRNISVSLDSVDINRLDLNIIFFFARINNIYSYDQVVELNDTCQ